MKCQILYSRKNKKNIPKETISMKCQILYYRKNKKSISKCCLLKFLSSMQSVNEWHLNSLHIDIKIWGMDTPQREITLI